MNKPRPAKITFLANYLPDKQESMLRLSELFRDVLEEAGFETETIRPIDRVGKLRRVFPRMEKWLGYVDKYLIFPFELFFYALGKSRDRCVVYHITDHSNAVYSFVLRGRPRMATCNDVLAIRSALGEIPENPTGFTGRLLQRAILAGLRNTPRIVCISENSAHELSKLLGDGGPKVTSALLPLNFDFSPMPKDEAMAAVTRLDATLPHVLRAGFVLHVGGDQWYKNRVGVCTIYAELVRIRAARNRPVIPLVLAGKAPSPELADFARSNGRLEIVFITTPSNEEVRALYSLAAVFLFPSLQEGFGWPIVEAMACGCPVVTTGRAPMTEGGGEAAIYIDPSDIEGSAGAINELLDGSESERAVQVEKGLSNVKRFTRSSLAAHYALAYEDALKPKGSFPP